MVGSGFAASNDLLFAVKKFYSLGNKREMLVMGLGLIAVRARYLGPEVLDPLLCLSLTAMAAAGHMVIWSGRARNCQGEKGHAETLGTVFHQVIWYGSRYLFLIIYAFCYEEKTSAEFYLIASAGRFNFPVDGHSRLLVPGIFAADCCYLADFVSFLFSAGFKLILVFGSIDLFCYGASSAGRFRCSFPFIWYSLKSELSLRTGGSNGLALLVLTQAWPMYLARFFLLFILKSIKLYLLVNW